MCNDGFSGLALERTCCIPELMQCVGNISIIAALRYQIITAGHIHSTVNSTKTAPEVQTITIPSLLISRQSSYCHISTLTHCLYGSEGTPAYCKVKQNIPVQKILMLLKFLLHRGIDSTFPKRFQPAPNENHQGPK